MFSCRTSTLFLMSTTLALVLRTLPNLLAAKSTDSLVIASAYFRTIARVFFQSEQSLMDSLAYLMN